jgi:hypothetical protein
LHGALKEQVGFGLRAFNVPALDNDGPCRESKRLE